MTRERMKQLDDELSATESHELWMFAKGNKGDAPPFPVRCDSTPMEARTGPSARLDQSK